MTEPQPSDGFEWAQAPWGRVLRCRPLAAIAPHFFTDRSLELRADDPEWTRVAQFAGVSSERLVLLRQVHGRTIVSADIGRDGDGRRPPEADGVISQDPESALVVRVADCAPILMADRRTGAVAAVHAGWRSTMQQIVDHAVAMLVDRFGSKPGDLLAAIGPSLGQCCGEMGEEVVAAFRAAGHSGNDIDRWFDRTGRKPHFDLWRANRDQLERAGVPAENVFSAGLCTKTHATNFHSYRADGANAGRMAAVIRAANPRPATTV